MIAQIEGKLISLDGDHALVGVGAIAYEVMLPGYVVSELSGRIGEEIRLLTMEYYEGTPVGGNLIPRMVGFLNRAEKDFFVKFTSVKGIGIKKGLRCLSIPIGTVAAAIEDGDEKMLCALPQVGKRLAQHIIAELKGKLGNFAAAAVIPAGAGKELSKAFQVEALEILIAWGEKRTEAAELIQLACKRHPQVSSAEELVPLVYRIKQGIEV
ncbi:MAG: Holliday junction branch migration protein RuvA [Planctomycetota bacterium]